VRKSALCALGLIVAALVALGLVVLSSASEVRGAMKFADPMHFVKRQAVYVALGLVLAACVAAFDYRKWRDHWFLTFLFCAAVFAGLIAVFFFEEVKGSHRWINLGPASFQPGEFAKLATVLAVSVWLDKAAWKVELFKNGALCPAAIIGVMAAPVLLEPDFGSVMVIGGVGFMLMFVAGTRILHLAPIFAAGLAVVAWKVAHNANRMRRLISHFGSSAADAAGSAAQGAAAAVDPAAYQADMSLVAISRGGIYGVGLSGSMQKQNYLPEAWTDFIFAVGAEEMGLIYSLAVVALFLAFFAISVHVAAKAADRFGRFLALGMAFIISFQAVFNLGVVCKAFPTKGMALPFFSYGGTNMLASFFAVGIILSVGIHSLQDRRRDFVRKTVINMPD